MARKSNQPITDGDRIVPAGNESGTIQDGRSDSTLDTIGGLPAFDPASLGDGDSDSTGGNGVTGEPAKRGRGRPKGGGNAGTRSTQKDKAVSVTGIEKLLLSTHNLLARLTKVEEMKLDNDEAKMIAEALANVQQHYSVVVDPKYLAWMGLIGVCVTIYAPRIGVLIMTKKAQNKKQVQNNPAENVTQMHKPVEMPAFNPQQFNSKGGM